MTNEAANFTTIQVIFVSSVTVHVPEDLKQEKILLSLKKFSTVKL